MPTIEPQLEVLAPPLASLVPVGEWSAPARSRGGFSAAVLAAALAHGTALAGLLVALDAPYGYSGLERNAIDVSLVDASALERPAIDQLAAANGAGEDSYIAAAIETASLPARAAQAETQPDAKTKFIEDVVPPEAAPIVVAKETAETPAEVTETVDKSLNFEPQEQAAVPSAQPSEAASYAPSLETSPAIGAATAAAPPGVAKDYARSVVKAIASSKPSGSGGNGIVHLAFSISTAGQLDDVRITKSSGSAKLDQTAIATVRRARFVPPPPGMSAQQLVYEMPFNFR
jgi:protein TonB